MANQNFPYIDSFEIVSKAGVLKRLPAGQRAVRHAISGGPSRLHENKYFVLKILYFSIFFKCHFITESVRKSQNVVMRTSVSSHLSIDSFTCMNTSSDGKVRSGSYHLWVIIFTNECHTIPRVAVVLQMFICRMLSTLHWHPTHRIARALWRSRNSFINVIKLQSTVA